MRREQRRALRKNLREGSEEDVVGTRLKFVEVNLLVEVFFFVIGFLGGGCEMGSGEPLLSIHRWNLLK